ncbi:hypothetical protein NA78x_001592 [Anatilimnocola sp. NA78]|uniref:hypothetical protein n=1 Tax=Anatilimnocola sp. NA78 TaxID=3415683 RepID=UPI003CE593EF
MTRRRHDDWEDDASNDEDFDDDYDREDDDEPTVPCPYCRRDVHEDAQRCPYCEQYLSGGDSPPARKPWWIYVTVGICLIIALRWIFLLGG